MILQQSHETWLAHPLQDMECVASVINKNPIQVIMLMMHITLQIQGHIADRSSKCHCVVSVFFFSSDMKEKAALGLQG
jgi:hypothetical protein